MFLELMKNVDSKGHVNSLPSGSNVVLWILGFDFLFTLEQMDYFC